MVPLLLASIFLLVVLVAGFLARFVCGRAEGAGRGRRHAPGRGISGGAPPEPERVAPLEVRLLKPRSQKWKFKKAIPKGLRLLADRVRFVKRAIRSKTFFTDETGPADDPVIPEGFRVWAPPPAARVADARREIAALFEREIALPEAARHLHTDQRKTRGLYYLFTGADVKERMYCDETLGALDAAAPVLAEFCREYYRLMSRIYRFDPVATAKKVQIVFLRYDPGHGIWLHIDNVSRYDRGPIATVSLGPPDVTYDLTPSLAEAGAPIRVRMREGDLVVMDGRSRMEWAHGLPYGLPSYKYTIMFKCDHFTDHVVGHQPIIRTNIYEAIPGAGLSGGAEAGGASATKGASAAEAEGAAEGAAEAEGASGGAGREREEPFGGFVG